MEYLLSSLCFVCELEVLKNDVVSFLLSSHLVSLLTWAVFFCYLILSTFQLLSLWGVFLFFPSVNFGNEMDYERLHTEMQQWTSQCRQHSLWARFPLLPMWTKLRGRGRGLVLQRCLIVFYFANLFYKCALLGLTMEFIPRNNFFLKTGSHFNSDYELHWKDFAKGSVSLLWQGRPRLGFGHVLSSWLVSGHIRIVTYFCMTDRDRDRCYLISVGNILIKKERKV